MGEADWQEALTNAVRAARPQLAVGSIVGIFMGDEVQSADPCGQRLQVSSTSIIA